jgi:cobalt-zinc-cadmium efflux system outer membrane protein
MSLLDRLRRRGTAQPEPSPIAELDESVAAAAAEPWLPPKPEPKSDKKEDVFSGSISRSAPVPSPTTPAPKPPSDVRRTQATPRDLQIPTAPDAAAPSIPVPSLPAVIGSGLGGQSMSLEAALYGTLTGNPDLTALRQGGPNIPSPESVEVARHFPTALNPTVWIDYRPITLIPNNTFANQGGGPGTTMPHHGFYQFGQNYLNVSLRFPAELGHQTTHRYNIAKAALSQQQWTVTQAEMTALVQTYRFFETAAYRREKLRISQELANFNDRLYESLKRRQEANLVPAADATLALVESRATQQLVKAAKQDYVTALTDLRNQVGIPESAGAAEPFGEFTLPPYIPPVDEQGMIQTALANRPDIRAAQALVSGTCSAIRLAKGDRIPTPVIGPQYAQDEAGIQYVGLILVSTLPVLNNGMPLVRQREAEHRRAIVAMQQAQQRAVAQVRAAVAKWNGATELVNESQGLTSELAKEVESLERLFDRGQADLTKLMQARQRLIQLQNAELDALWAATQAQADLLLALGAPILLNAMRGEISSTAAPAAATPAPAAAPALSPAPVPPPSAPAR